MDICDELLDGDPGSEKSDKKPTICSECKYFNSPPVSSRVALCANPQFAFKPEYNYITGSIKNEMRPKCEDINIDGNCPGYANDKLISPVASVVLILICILTVMVCVHIVVNASEGRGMNITEFLSVGLLFILLCAFSGYGCLKPER
jgi:hypothetical protein